MNALFYIPVSYTRILNILKGGLFFDLFEGVELGSTTSVDIKLIEQ